MEGVGSVRRSSQCLSVAAALCLAIQHSPASGANVMVLEGTTCNGGAFTNYIPTREPKPEREHDDQAGACHAAFLHSRKWRRPGAGCA